MTTATITISRDTKAKLDAFCSRTGHTQKRAVEAAIERLCKAGFRERVETITGESIDPTVAGWLTAVRIIGFALSGAQPEEKAQ